MRSRSGSKCYHRIFWTPRCHSAPPMHDWRMAQLDDLDDWIDGYLRFLRDVYYETDPNKGQDSEIAKHELAQLAIERFWYLHGKLLSWAQAHMTGYCILSENPSLVGFLEEKLGYEINEDSHLLEHIGFQYNFNPPDGEDNALEQNSRALRGVQRPKPRRRRADPCAQRHTRNDKGITHVAVRRQFVLAARTAKQLSGPQRR